MEPHIQLREFAVDRTPTTFSAISFDVQKLLKERPVKWSHTLLFVCKLWHAMALPLLYQTIQITSAKMAKCFLRTLVESASGSPFRGHGQWVRHLILPQFYKSYWPRQNFQIIDVLERCPFLHTLWKPDYSHYEDGVFWHAFLCPQLPVCTRCPPPTMPSMTALRHIHWIFSYPPEIVDLEATRLTNLLFLAPNLISISIRSAGTHIPGTSLQIRPRVPLASLTTLEYCGNTKSLVLFRNDMPNLTHIITTPERLDDNASLLSEFGQQLEVIEFLDPHFPTHFDSVASILRQCPNLHTLRYNINNVRLPDTNVVLHPSLRNIVLGVSHWMADDDSLEQCLFQGVITLTGNAFPALRRVVLAGTAGCNVNRSRFERAYTVLRRRFPAQRVDGLDMIWDY